MVPREPRVSRSARTCPRGKGGPDLSGIRALYHELCLRRSARGEPPSKRTRGVDPAYREDPLPAGRRRARRVPSGAQDAPRIPRASVQLHPLAGYDVTALRRIATHLRRAYRAIATAIARIGRGSGREYPSSLFRKFAAVFRGRGRDGEGEGKKTETGERFVGGCDESKSGSHWTELRKSVDREDRKEAEGGGGKRRWWRRSPPPPLLVVVVVPSRISSVEVERREERESARALRESASENDGGAGGRERGRE